MDTNCTLNTVCFRFPLIAVCATLITASNQHRQVEKDAALQGMSLTDEFRSTYRLNPEDVVLGVGAVCQSRHPAELSVEQVQDEGGVEHLLLEPLQEVVVLLSETLGHGQRLLQLLLQLALQRFLPGAVCEGNR